MKKCAVKGAGLQRVQFPPGNWFAPPGRSNRNGTGANKGVKHGEREKIDSVATLRTVVSQLRPGDAAVLQVEREGGLMYLSFEME